MYKFEKRDESSDYTKRQILLTQENFKVLLPAMVLLSIALIALNAANFAHEFMAIYINVLINVVGVAAVAMIAVRLSKENSRQRDLFEFLRQKRSAGAGEKIRARYLGDTDGILKGVRQVDITETESEFVMTAALPEYKHSPFTAYDFRGDFVRLVLPKSDYRKESAGGKITLSGEGRAFEFAAADGEDGKTTK